MVDTFARGSTWQARTTMRMTMTMIPVCLVMMIEVVGPAIPRLRDYIVEYQRFNPLHLPLQSATKRYIFELQWLKARFADLTDRTYQADRFGNLCAVKRAAGSRLHRQAGCLPYGVRDQMTPRSYSNLENGQRSKAVSLPQSGIATALQDASALTGTFAVHDSHASLKRRGFP